jgi:hypothetical protein
VILELEPAVITQHRDVKAVYGSDGKVETFKCGSDVTLKLSMAIRYSGEADTTTVKRLLESVANVCQSAGSVPNDSAEPSYENEMKKMRDWIVRTSKENGSNKQSRPDTHIKGSRVVRRAKALAAEDALDIVVARSRLKDIDNDPSLLVKGEDLQKKLDEFENKPSAGAIVCEPEIQLLGQQGEYTLLRLEYQIFDKGAYPPFVGRYGAILKFRACDLPKCALGCDLPVIKIPESPIDEGGFMTAQSPELRAALKDTSREARLANQTVLARDLIVTTPTIPRIEHFIELVKLQRELGFDRLIQKLEKVLALLEAEKSKCGQT